MLGVVSLVVVSVDGDGGVCFVSSCVVVVVVVWSLQWVIVQVIGGCAGASCFEQKANIT